MVPDHEPVLVAGDFNDWRKRATPFLQNELGLKEAFLEFQGDYAKTFPAWLPVFSLDRIYYCGVILGNAQCLVNSPWNKLSDHAALLCDFYIPKDETKSAPMS